MTRLSHPSRVRRSVVMVAGALVLPLAACGGDAAAAGPVVRDSAGIRIVQNDAPVWKEGAGWSVVAEPVLDIGVVEGEAAYQLDGVRGVARLSDGRVVVADGGSLQVRFFSAEGRHLSSTGRQGGGPGEFERIGWVGAAAGDSVLVWDPEASRLTVLGPEGRLARVVSPGGLRESPRVEAAMGDGTLLVWPGFDPGEILAMPQGEYRETAVWMRLSLAGGAPMEVSRRPGQERFFNTSEGGTATTQQVTFGRGVFVAGAPDGFYAGESERYQVEHRGPDGALRRLIRRAHAPRPVTAADLDAQFAGQNGASAGSPEERASRRREFDRVPHRATLPAFAQLLVDADGRLWVRDPQPRADEAHRWSVFDADGRWLGTVRTPAGFEVRQIGADWILGTARDELDVEHVRMYRIRKGAS